jgi:hypothetical protein
LGGDSWLAWRVLLIAAMGEPLTDEERAIFAKLTGREREPGERVDELWCVVGGAAANREPLRACWSISLLRTYGVAKVIGDRYAGEWVREPFRRHGIDYQLSEAP